MSSKLERRLDLVFSRPLSEDMSGLAAAYQPNDILQRLKQAMHDLKITDELRKSGITNKVSPDRQTVRFYITDAQGREREIASYEIIKLADASTMEKALKDLRDLASNRAPGTTDREMEALRNKEAELRKIAKKHVPKAPEDQFGESVAGTIKRLIQS